MTAAGTAIAAAPPDAVELRIVRYRLRRTVGAAASEWLGDVVAGSDGPSGDSRPLVTATVHWITAPGGTVVFQMPAGEQLTPDDVASLFGAARQRRLRCSVWFETDRLGGGSMRLAESWFVGAELSPPSPPVTVEQSPDGVTVSVAERVGPRRYMLLFYPVLLVSFAWVAFLFIGGLPKMIRDIWQRGVVGVDQQFVATLDARELRVVVTRNGRESSPIVVGRAGLIAVGTSLGFVAYTAEGAVSLATEWATMNAGEQHTTASAVAAAINSAIGAA